MGKDVVSGKVQDSMAKSLEEIISKGDTDKFFQTTETNVAFLSEVGFNAAYFDHDTYLSALDKMAEIGVDGVVVDGAALDCKAVEYLNPEDTHYETINDEVPERMARHFEEKYGIEKMDVIPNRMRYHQNTFLGLERVDRHIGEMRKKMPDAEIYLNIRDDDVGLTIKQLIHQELIGKKQQKREELKSLERDRKDLEEKVKQYKEKSNELKEKITEARKNLKEGKEAKISIEIDGETKEYGIDEAVKLRENWRKSRSRKRKRIDKLRRDYLTGHELLTDTVLKPNKGTPFYQQTQREVVEWLYGYYEEIAKKHNVKLVTKNTTLDINGFKISYAHNRRLTKGVVKNREQATIKEVQGKARKLRGIDAYLESGHHGKAFKSTIKLEYSREEWNHENVGDVDPKLGDHYIFVGAVLSFERKDLITPYLDGGKNIELAGAKPTSTKSHEVVKRHDNGAKTGLTILTKRSDGMVGSRWIGMKRFYQPEKYPERKEKRSVFAYTDQHINSDEANEMMVRGFLELYKKSLALEETVNGVPTRAAGMNALGDHQEANSDSWNHRYGPNVNPDEAMDKGVKGVVHLAKLAMKVERGEAEEMELLGTMYNLLLLQGRLAKSGGTAGENMAATVKRGAKEYLGIIKNTLANSELQDSFVGVTGNHADGPLRKTGFNELSMLEGMLEGINQVSEETGVEIPYFKMGEANPFKDPTYEKARVLLGGISNFRGCASDRYGRGVNGEDLFGGYTDDEGKFRHLKVNWQHDPKGSNGTGLEGVMKNNDADYAFQGHVHFDYLVPVEDIDGELRFRHMLGTTQGPAPTEKYYAKSMPRAQLGYRLIMEKDDYTELAMPAANLQAFGRAQLAGELKKEWEKVAA